MVSSTTKWLACFLLLLTLAAPSAAEPLAENRLIGMAESYVALFDQARYEDAWETMSPLFRALSDYERWARRQQAVRNGYGPLASRSLNRVDRRQTYGQSPDGRYVIVQFRSSFRNKADTNETVVLDCRSGSGCTVRDYILR